MYAPRQISRQGARSGAMPAGYWPASVAGPPAPLTLWLAPDVLVLSDVEEDFDASLLLLVVLLALARNWTSLGESTRVQRSVPQA